MVVVDVVVVVVVVIVVEVVVVVVVVIPRGQFASCRVCAMYFVAGKKGKEKGLPSKAKSTQTISTLHPQHKGGDDAQTPNVPQVTCKTSTRLPPCSSRRGSQIH